MRETQTSEAISPPQPHAARPRRAIWIVALAVCAALLVIVASFPRIERFYLRQAGADDAATLRLATQVLRGALERTEALPALLAEQPILRQLLAEPQNQGIVPFTNELLRQTALSLEVSDIYVMDVSGTTVATSNYRSDTSFMGQVFDYRPYFADALGAGLGRFHALGTTSGQRGYFFAAPVIDETQIVGVIAVKLTLDGFEEAWAESGSVITVTDANNVVFLSDRTDWHYRTVGPLPEAALEQIATTRQYPPSLLQPLDLRTEALDPDIGFGLELANVGVESFVRQTTLIASAGWRVSIHTPTGPAAQQAWTAVLLLSLVVVMIGLVIAIILGRRARLIERLEAEQSLAALLEARVTERTAALKSEVEERRAAEERLRATQKELVQAGKLAALGAMSAALSHEFNQPLAAVKSYAENAGTYLDRGRTAEARENVTRISGMADRMASISKHLRNFARRPQDLTGPVRLKNVISDALDLMQPRLRNVEVSYTCPDQEVWARGGPVRLQQVLVNLLGNALDAMQGRVPQRIEITLTDGDAPEISVRDFGPGLSRAALDQAFDPFFTTKEPGQGLGLGLSISYNIVRDFGGHLAASNHTEGGAVFRIVLEATEPDSAEVAAQ
ncbi:sensor histidine kinase [Rhodobacterales bacterium HKCCE4037]|nr:sensor histidine kinase [Rhodobacterales bacterium HKCCE4037]